MIKTTSCLLAGALCAFSMMAPALAQSAFPNKPIEVIVPYPPGGGTDMLGRAFAEASRTHVGQPLIVINRAGASGAIGWADVVNGKPDGYKMVLLATEHGLHQDHL
jgi:tripartite-type tricarboxylate transporter receptor subunit TctC